MAQSDSGLPDSLPFSARLQARLESLATRQQLRGRSVLQRTSAVHCHDGRQQLISFATNDYLGLSCEPRVCQAFADTALQQAGSGASPLVAGRSHWQERLETRLAELEGCESVVLFASGYAANLGTLMALAGSQDAVFCDRENHASLVDGCRASDARFLVYDRQQPERLQRSLARRRRDFDQVFLVTDTVFSMDGSLADLPLLAELARTWQAVLVVDEAHATGVFGAEGHGVCELQGVRQEVAVCLGTLSKAVGCLGGFAAGSQQLSDWLWNSARSQFFSTALPPAVCAAALEALQILQHDTARRQRLQQRASQLRGLLLEGGLVLAGYRGTAAAEASLNPAGSPIVGVLVGDEQSALQASARLREAGFLIPAIRPPTVAEGTSRLRLSVCSEHTEQQIADAAAAVLKACGRHAVITRSQSSDHTAG